jgi:arylsulfatase A-like enzyme
MAVPRAFRSAIPSFLAAFTGTLIFKIALFRYSTSGAEGVSSVLATWPRLALCLGWDVVSAMIVAGVATALWWPSAVEALYGVFLVVSYHIATIVGSPLDKAAIDLLFVYNATPGTTRQLFADSVVPYVTPAVVIEALLAAAIMPAVFLWWRQRVERGPAIGRRAAAAFAVLVFLTVAVVPGLANGLLAVHTFGLERSPLTLLVGSYVSEPFRRLIGRDTVPEGDPYCFDLQSPVPVAGANPLTKAAPSRTNLVVVILESISAHTVAVEPTPMPFLDGLGRSSQGVRFENHYTHWAQTMKAAFSLWCAELPHPEYPPITYVNPAIPCVSLPEALKGAGYDTALFSSADFAFDRQVRFLRHRRFDSMIDRNEMPGRQGAWQNTWGLDERVTTAAVLEWIRRQRSTRPDRRFFAAYNMAAGHHPYEYPGSPSGRWLDGDREAAAQRATLRFVDDRLRELLDGLRSQQLLDSTLVAVVSDHGPGSGRAGIGRVRDASIYEGSVHVPLVLLGPQLAGASGAVTLPTGHIDLAPTLLGLLDLQPPATMKGRDLTHGSEPRVVILATRPPLSQIGVRAGPWKLVHWAETGADELFDLAHDPDEREDVSAGHRELVARLDAIGHKWQTHSRHLIENYAAVLAASGHRCSSP